MSDVDQRVVALPPSQAEAHYAGVVSMQAAQARVWRDAWKRGRWRDIALTVAVVAEAVAISFLVPNQHYITIFSYLNPSGVHDTATAISTLPADQRIAGIEALLWQYLRFREHYAPSEAENSYNIVSAMSSEHVREQYQKWANPINNPKAPAITLGKTGFIRVYRENGTFIRHSADYATGVYQIRFCRLVAPEGQTPFAQRWSDTFSYQLADSIPLWERVTFNHAGLVVTEYPGPESEGAGPKTVMATGGEHPCD